MADTPSKRLDALEAQYSSLERSLKRLRKDFKQVIGTPQQSAQPSKKTPVPRRVRELPRCAVDGARGGPRGS